MLAVSWTARVLEKTGTAEPKAAAFGLQLKTARLWRWWLSVDC